MNRSADSTYAKWSVPQCRFFIEYAPRVVDDIRLAVVDAFFSLPKGGVEMGGILLGGVDGDRLTIVDSVPLECEHAFGPSFMLSANDVAKLENQLAELPSGGNTRPVGWYHSHTRSDVFLSDADLEIYRRFFPEPWQVALVLRPHSFEPVRAGFFFREPDGSVHTTASYEEFLLDPLPIQQLPVHPANLPPPISREPLQRTPPAPTSTAPVLEAQAVREVFAPVIPPLTMPATPVVEARAVHDVPAPVIPEPPTPTQPEPKAEPPSLQNAPVPMEPPRFLAEPAEPSRRWLSIVAVLLAVAVGVAGYQTRDRWLPRTAGQVQKVDPPPPAVTGLGLTTVDAAGQLQIRWNRSAPAIQQGTGGLLMIVDGRGAPKAKGLDAALLQSGTFTYGRLTGQVDITLTIHQPDGTEVRESAAFLGPSPVRPAAGEGLGTRKKQDALAERTTRLQTDLNKQAARTKQLEKNIDEMRREMQKKRMESQIPDPEKK